MMIECCPVRSAAAPQMNARAQGSILGWARYVGMTGHTIGMETFGASAPLKALPRKFGFTPEPIVAAAKAQVAQAR
jgi:transketolase